MMVEVQTDSTVESVVGRLSHRAKTIPDRVALRQKLHGIWREVTWAELDRGVTSQALALTSLGVAEGGVVAIVADNSIEWIVADLAVQRAGAAVLALLPQTSAADLRALFERYQVGVAFCGDQEHVDLVLAADPSGLAAVLAFDACGLSRYDDKRIRTAWQAQRPADALAGGGEAVVSAARLSSPVVAIDVAQAGLSGLRGVEVKGSDAAAAARRTAEWLQLRESDRTFCLMPLGDVVARSIDLYASIDAGAQIHLPETLTSVQEDLAEVAPTVLSGSHEAVSRIRRASQIRERRSGRLRRRFITWGMNVGAQSHGRIRSGIPATPRRILVTRPLAAQHGLASVRKAVVTGDGRLHRGVAGFFRALGISVAQVWGEAQYGGLVVVHGEEQVTPLPGLAARVEDDGALTISRGGDAADYLRTAARVREGSDGVLQLLSRPVAAGLQRVDRFQIADVERELCANECIRRVVLHHGDAGEELVALVEIDFDMSSLWATQRGLDFTTNRSLAEHPAVLEMVESQIHRVNAASAAQTPISSFAVLPRSLTVADGDLTPHRHARIDVVFERFSGLLRGVRQSGPELA